VILSVSSAAEASPDREGRLTIRTAKNSLFLKANPPSISLCFTKHITGRGSPSTEEAVERYLDCGNPKWLVFPVNPGSIFHNGRGYCRRGFLPPEKLD
jgi:hypothetical protein